MRPVETTVTFEFSGGKNFTMYMHSSYGHDLATLMKDERLLSVRVRGERHVVDEIVDKTVKVL